MVHCTPEAASCEDADATTTVAGVSMLKLTVFKSVEILAPLLYGICVTVLVFCHGVHAACKMLLNCGCPVAVPSTVAFTVTTPLTVVPV